MRNVWLVLRWEYLHMAAKRSFLISTLALPIGFGLIVAVTILVAEGTGGDARPIGYVDVAGVLPEPVAVETGEEDLAVIRYPSVAEGEEAVRAGTVQVLFVLPPDYVTDPGVDVVVLDHGPSDRAWSRWNSYVRDGLLLSYPRHVRERVTADAAAIVRDAAGYREIDETNVASIVIPVIAAVLFMVGSAMSSGYLLQAVVTEKENRTMEVMVTSVTPSQLIAGKTVGLLSVALTQLAIWVGAGLAALAVYAALSPDALEVAVPWGSLLLMLAFLLPSYGLLAAVMVAIGGIVDDGRHAEALSGPLMLPFMAPMAMMPYMITRPSGPLITALTLFPTTSFLTISVRSAFGTVPAGQLVLSWLLLAGSTAGAMWLAGRIFRLGMLMYGQRLSLRQIMADLRGPARVGEGAE